MSKGYTIAFAITAPVAPATASPQGGMSASFDCPAIMKRNWSQVGGVERAVVFDVYRGASSIAEKGVISRCLEKGRTMEPGES